MQIGAMNHPARDLAAEITWIGEQKFDFIDLTLEAPQSRAERVSVEQIRELTGRYGLAIVGHTSPFLPMGSGYESARAAAVHELERALDVFAALNVQRVNVHVDGRTGAESEADNIRNNLWTLTRFAAAAEQRGIQPMVEHFGPIYSKIPNLRTLLDSIPGLWLHVDIGHANLWSPQNFTAELLDAFAPRLGHVHVSDNFGGDRDLHLPLGAGNIGWPQMIQLLKSQGYDGTITPEVFSRDRDYLIMAQRKLRAWWDAA